MNTPTILIDGERWNVASTNQHGVTAFRNGSIRFVKHEDVR